MKPRRWTFASLRAAYEGHASGAAANLEIYRRDAMPAALVLAQAHALAWWRLSDIHMDAVLRPEAHPEIVS